jgi:two-component system KDP operon response regulator KdpE
MYHKILATSRKNGFKPAAFSGIVDKTPLTIFTIKCIMWTVRSFRVLLVDDEVRILNFLSVKLKTSGYDVLTAQNGFEALEQAQANEPDMVVLDVLMPRMDGFETLKQLRTFSSVPVIILSGKETNADKVKGLSLGADDYLPKPFNPEELVARIEAVRRRLDSSQSRKMPGPLSLGHIFIDFDRRQVLNNGKDTGVTRIEWLLISELTHNVGRVLTYEHLLTHIWGPEYRQDIQLLRTWISRLRSKLETDPKSPTLIRTIPKTGYIIDQP